MNKIFSFFAVGIVVMFFMTACRNNQGNHKSVIPDSEGPRSHILFDFDWKFHRGDVDGAGNANFDDKAWRRIDLPHDWSIEDIPGKKAHLIHLQ
jgi:beta-galactosidase